VSRWVSILAHSEKPIRSAAGDLLDRVCFIENNEVVWKKVAAFRLPVDLGFPEA
jgi:hypothetical protein